MRSVPTGRKVIFTQPLPPSSQDEDVDDAYGLDPLLALDLADTIAAENGQGSTPNPDGRDEGTGDDEAAPPPTVLDRLDGLMPSVAVVLQMIEDEVAADLRARLADGGTAFLLLRYPADKLGWQQLARDAASAFATLAFGIDHRARNVVALSRPKEGRGVTELDALAVALQRMRIVVGLSDTAGESSDPYEPFADKVVVLSALAPKVAVGVLDRALGPLGETDRTALAAIDVAALSPAAFDLAILRSQTVAEAIKHLRLGVEAVRSAGPKRTTKSEPTLDTLPGYGAVMGWAKGLARDIRAYAAGTLGWDEVDHGALLTGPPGTGKTLLAGALARSAGCRVVLSSAATWLAEDGGSMGAVVKAIRRAFEEASNQLPTVLFVDEIDSIPARGSSAKWNDYWTPINNALLEALDGSTRREGLVVLAACNHPDRLDSALLRSGRLDRIVTIDLPSADDLQAILRYHLPGVLTDDDAERVAYVLEGTATGADVQRIAREARSRARSANRPVEAHDLLAVALPPDTRSESYLWRVAVHEAGHAIAQMVAGRMPASVSIVAFGAYGGAVRTEALADEAVLAGDVAQRMVVPLLAARAAEEVILGSVSAGAGGGPSSDLAKATGLVTAGNTMLGLGPSLLWSNAADADETEHVLQRLYGEATLLVLRHRLAVEALARVLVQERVVGRGALRRFAKRYQLDRERHPPDS